MIVFGYDSKVYDGPHTNSICPTCEKVNLNINLIRKYFYLWYIPIFPYSSNFLFSCSNCNNHFKYNDDLINLSPRILREFKKKSPPKWWMFSGLILLAISIAINSWNSYINADKITQEKNERLKLIQTPTVNAKYIFTIKHNDKDFYGYFKITKINSDEIEFIASDYYYSKKHQALEKLKFDDFPEENKEIMDEEDFRSIEIIDVIWR